MKIKLLFVDQDKSFLLSVRRTLRSLLREWDVSYAFNYEEAMTTIKKSHVDIVFAEKGILNENGEHLFLTLKKKYPTILRIIIDEAMDSQSALNHIPLAMQFLAKPCSLEEIQILVNKSLTLQTQINHNALKDKIIQIETLPSLPSLYTKVKEVIQNPDASVQEVVTLVQQDLAMTAKLMQISNSGFFGGTTKVDSVEQAIQRLGLAMVANLVLIVHIFNSYENKPCPGFSIEEMWKRNLKIAMLSRLISKEETHNDALCDNAYTAGLLHNIGKLVIATEFPQHYQKVLHLQEEDNLSEWEAEEAVFNLTQADVSAHLAEVWNFPASIVSAIKNCFFPLKAVDESSFSPLTAVHIALSLFHDTTEEIHDALELSYIKKLGLGEHLARWIQIRDEANNPIV